MLGLFIVVLWIFLYFFPSITAYSRKIDNIEQVVIINFFLGWTFIGWVIALVMAYKKVEKKA